MLYFIRTMLKANIPGWSNEQNNLKHPRADGSPRLANKPKLSLDFELVC